MSFLQNFGFYKGVVLRSNLCRLVIQVLVKLFGSKNSIFPQKKLHFRQQKLDFWNNLSSIWLFWHQEIAMNHKVSQKELISDQILPKTAKTWLFYEKNLICDAKNSIWNAKKNLILKAKNSILKAKTSIFWHFTWVDSSAFAPKKSGILIVAGKGLKSCYF